MERIALLISRLTGFVIRDINALDAHQPQSAVSEWDARCCHASTDHLICRANFLGLDTLIA